MVYLTLEDTFEIIIKRDGNIDNVLKPIKEAMDKFGFSIIETQPIKKKDCIHFKCNTCSFEGTQQYKNLIKYKSKCNCSTDISKKISEVNDVLNIKKYRLLFEKSNITIVPSQNFINKRVTSEFEYTCTSCNHTFIKTLDELAIHLKKFAGHKGCENCAQNDNQVYLSLDDTFKIIFTREARDNVLNPLLEAMDKYNFSIAQIEPVITKEKIQYMCNICHYKGTCSYYTLLRKGNCRKCNGHVGGGTKPTIINSFKDVLNIPTYKDLFEQTSYILTDKNFDLPKTISSTFYFQCKECSYEIGPNLISYIKTCLTKNPDTKGCVGCKKKNLVKSSDKCEHGTTFRFCIQCGGNGLCEHGNNKYACSIYSCRKKHTRYCKHDKLITTCKECCKHMCIHEILKYRCKDCNYPSYIKSLIRSRIHTEIKKHELRKDKSSIQYLGCNIEHLIHVFSEYYKVDKLTDDIHVDHIKPLSMFDLTKIEDMEQAFYWTNLQPLDATQNRIKSNTWNDELEEWWRHEIQLKLELFPYKNETCLVKEYKIYTMAPDKFKNYTNFLSVNTDLVVISTAESLKNTKKFVFKCNKCDTTHTLAQTSFLNKMGMIGAEDFCTTCYKIKCDEEKFEETKKEIFDLTNHVLLTCEFGGSRKCTYECGNCKAINSTRYFNLKTNSGECPKCCKKNDIECIVKDVDNLGFILLTTKETYTNNKNLVVQCKCKKYPSFTISLIDLKRGRRKCKCNK